MTIDQEKTFLKFTLQFLHEIFEFLGPGIYHHILTPIVMGIHIKFLFVFNCFPQENNH
jgi:hypothetical protein